MTGAPVSGLTRCARAATPSSLDASACRPRLPRFPRFPRFPRLSGHPAAGRRNGRAGLPYHRGMRALRRHHQARLKKARRFLWGPRRDLHSEPGRAIGIAIDTPKPCSCWMCGNPRRYFGERSLQELRADEAARSDDPDPSER